VRHRVSSTGMGYRSVNHRRYTKAGNVELENQVLIRVFRTPLRKL
jgi:hypothetical protein